MRRALHKLTAATARSARIGKYADGGGLWLHKRSDGGAQWVLRVTIHGRRREMGLGRYPDVSLKEAREAADKWRAVVRDGLDPIKERDRRRREEARKLHLLKDIAQDAFESRKAELKEDGKAGRWFTPLELHVLPRLGKVPVADIDQNDVRDALAPIWHTKADTARKAMNRLNICLRHAAALGLEVDLQATEKARALLGKQRHLVQHIPAMHWRDVPAFYQSLNGGSIAELALRFLILTAMRSRPVRFLVRGQIDGDVWIVPGEMMKGRKDATADFRVPLSSEAQSVLALAESFERGGYYFPSARSGVISDMTMSRLMERRGMRERPHGFRSSFRDWLAETTDTSYEIAETCLGHKVGGTVERAYRRSDFLEQRRHIFTRWSEFLNV